MSRPLRPRIRQGASPSVRWFRRLAATLFILTISMLAVVLYIASVQATIIITARRVPVTTNFFARLTSEPQGTADIPAAFFSEVITRKKTFAAQGEGVEIPAKAHGTVTIFNEQSTAQSLVATTRLLTPEGVLFRIVEGVNIPAKGKVQVEARADQPGKNGEVSPTRFTIPGLSVSKQSVVYATSADAMVGGVERRRRLTQDDFEHAQEVFVNDIAQEVVASWRAKAPASLAASVVKTEVISQATDVEEGTEAGAFTLSTSVRVNAVFYDADRLGKRTEQMVADHVADGQSFAGMNGEPNVALEQLDASKGTARARVEARGFAQLAASADVLNPERFIGLSAAQAKAYFEAFEAIESAEVKLSPFFVRHIPRLADHITVKIDNAPEQSTEDISAVGTPVLDAPAQPQVP